MPPNRKQVCRQRTFFVLVVVFLFSGCSALNSRRSEENLRESLLRLTPLGSSFEQVESVVKREGWKHARALPTHGFYIRYPLPERTIGKSSITATLGEHWWFPIGTEGAYAAWCFDENRRLIEIVVYKQVDTI
jgi:hypothetical protein